MTKPSVPQEIIAQALTRWLELEQGRRLIVEHGMRGYTVTLEHVRGPLASVALETHDRSLADALTKTAAAVMLGGAA